MQQDMTKRSGFALATLLAEILFSACATTGPAPGSAPSPAPEPRIRATAFSPDRSTLWYVSGAANCEVRALSVETGQSRSAFSLEKCPGALRVLPDGSLLFTGNNMDSWRAVDGKEVVPGRSVVAAVDVSNYVFRDGGELVWQHDSRTTAVGKSRDIEQVRALTKSTGLLFVRNDGSGQRLVRLTGQSTVELTPVFKRIDSFDVAPREFELALSAMRDTNFDVGIVSIDGGTINWVPPDPADEVLVTWAPRGNKITYAIRASDATFIRSVHVPTSFQLTFDLPFTEVSGIAWEAKAERIALLLESPSSSPMIDWVEYNGSGRKSLVAASRTIDATPERLIFTGGSGIVLAPSRVRYGVRLPLVIELVRHRPFAWRSGVAGLQESGLAGAVLVDPVSWEAGKAIDSILAQLVWADPERVFVLDPDGIAGADDSFARKGVTLVAIGKKPGGREPYRERATSRGGVVITIPQAPPAGDAELRAAGAVMSRLEDVR